MRDYGKVSPKFWTGKTGKNLRGQLEAQLVAVYLMTSPHSNMIGVFHLPILYLAHEIGLPLEGASKGLQRCIEEGFCQYDEGLETVFVCEMAEHQIGDALVATDKRVIGIQKQYEQLAESPIKAAFFERYGAAYHLKKGKGHRSPSEAPPKPGTGTGTGTGDKGSPRGSRLPTDWKPSADEVEWAKQARPDLDLKTQAERFRDYWIAKPGKDGLKLDWPATWRNWIRNANAPPGQRRPSSDPMPELTL